MTPHSGQPKSVKTVSSIRRSKLYVRPQLFVAALLAVMAGRLMVVAQEEGVPTSPPTPNEEPRVFLLEAPTFFESWDFYSAEEGAKRDETWRIVPEKIDDVTEKVLVCTGKPFGYLRSKEVYANCQFGLQWRFPKDENGNSGVLVYGVGKDEIWPKSIQVQFHRPKVGGVFPMKDATCDPQLPGKMLEKPASEWNTCVITCKDGTIALEINGEDFGIVKGCMPDKGFIALQSEGAEVHFRQIWKRPLK